MTLGGARPEAGKPSLLRAQLSFIAAGPVLPASAAQLRPLWPKGSRRQYPNNGAWPCSNKMYRWASKFEFNRIFMCHEINFYFFFKSCKDVKPFSAHRQGAGCVRGQAVVCCPSTRRRYCRDTLHPGCPPHPWTGAGQRGAAPKWEPEMATSATEPRAITF